MRRIPAPWLAFGLTLAAYGLAAGPTLARQSISPHYVYLADAMLHGRLNLIQPPTSYDLLQANGRWYVAQSPMPAVLMMPLVAVFGAGLSDVLFSVVVGALNAALVQAVFRRWWLTLLFAFGTPHLYLSALGTSWFTAHVVAVFFGLLAVRAVIPFAAATQGRAETVPASAWFRSGLWLACAGLARPTMLFGAIFFLLFIVLSQRRGLPTSEIPGNQESPGVSWYRRFAERLRTVLAINRRALIAFGAAIALGLAAHGIYNAARFGSPTDFGYQHVVGAPNITSTYARYGAFNPRFLSCNLFVSLLGPPEVNGPVPPAIYDLCGYLLGGVNLSDASALLTPNPLGMSLFLATPAFLLLFAARRRDPLTVAAWAGLLATMVPLWMYHNTGSLQFGYRYWMDATPFWLLLLSIAETSLRRFGRLAALFVPVSMVINVWGFLWMFDKLNGATWLEMMRR